jgi:hypothetical protein
MKNGKNGKNRKNGKNGQRLQVAVGKEWPQVREDPTDTESVRGGVLFGILCLCAALLITFAAYAVFREDHSTISEILGLVKMLLSAIGGWAIGRRRE